MELAARHCTATRQLASKLACVFEHCLISACANCWREKIATKNQHRDFEHPNKCGRSHGPGELVKQSLMVLSNREDSDKADDSLTVCLYFPHLTFKLGFTG